MTLQDLLDELNKIHDKTIKVGYMNSDYQYGEEFKEIDGVQVVGIKLDYSEFPKIRVVLS